MGKLDDITFEIEILKQQLSILNKRIEKRRRIMEKSAIKKILHAGSAPYRFVKQALETGSIFKIAASFLIAAIATVTLICPILSFFEKVWDMRQSDKLEVLQNQKVSTQVRINELNEMKEQINATDNIHFNEAKVRERAIQTTMQQPDKIMDAGAELIKKTN